MKIEEVIHMEEAIQEACRGVLSGDGGPFGAVVVKDGKVVAVGHNMVLSRNDPTAHAEVTAIRNACEKLGTFELSGCVLYTSCYPCPMCMGASLWARFDAIYYAASAQDAASVGFDDQNFYDFIKDPKTDDVRTIERVATTDFMRPFTMWTSKIDKMPY